MKKTKSVPEIKVGPFKPIKYYEASIEGAEKTLKIFEDIGRQVITSDEYRNIGFNYVIKNAIDNKFELTSIKKARKNND